MYTYTENDNKRWMELSLDKHLAQSYVTSPTRLHQMLAYEKATDEEWWAPTNLLIHIGGVIVSANFYDGVD
jgi:hypothetical protein